MTGKQNIESRIDDLEEQPTDRTPVGEYWLRELSDELEDPQEPWEQWFSEVCQ